MNLDMLSRILTFHLQVRDEVITLHLPLVRDLELGQKRKTIELTEERAGQLGLSAGGTTG